ncbi:MAG: NYN domain-containing protein [Planctomycetes bacterium]|nr:NYN domain-containing protein [Planctomycetota bacterium]
MARYPIIIDAFNLFHFWEQTRDYFHSPGDLSIALGQSLRALSVALGGRKHDVLVVLDGDTRCGAIGGGLRIRQAGAGRKADDAIIDILKHQAGQAKVTVVTNDRELIGKVINSGGKPQRVEEFLASLNKPGPVPTEPEPPVKEMQKLSAREVEKWLKIFGDGSDIEAEEM